MNSHHIRIGQVCVDFAPHFSIDFCQTQQQLQYYVFYPFSTKYWTILLFRFLDDDHNDYDNHKISWYKYELSIILTYTFFLINFVSIHLFGISLRDKISKEQKSRNIMQKMFNFCIAFFFYMHNSAKLFIFPRKFSCKLEIERKKTQQQQA